MILMYHKVDIITPTTWWVTPADLEQHISRLGARQFVYLDDYTSTSDQAVITFDDAYENVCLHALPILRAHRLPFEVFVVGNTLGAWNDFDPGEPATRHMTLEQLGDVVRSGGRIQWHTRSHRDLRQLSTSDVEDELDVPTDLRQRFAKPHLSWLSYPYGWHDERIVAIARKRFSGAVSVTDGEPADRWQLNRVTMDRFVVVREDAALRSLLTDQLAQLRPPMRPRELEISEIRRVADDRFIWGFHVDSPVSGAKFHGAYEVAGWVLGRPPFEVKLLELRCNSELLVSAPVTIDRPDVLAVHARHPSPLRAGFALNGATRALPDEFALTLCAQLVDASGATTDHPIAEILGRCSRRPRGTFVPQPLQLIRRNRLRRSVDDLTRWIDTTFLAARVTRPFAACLGDCERETDPGIDEIAEYRDFSMRGTTPDQLRIQRELESMVEVGSSVLHVGVGNSSLALRLAYRVGHIDGITIQREEVDRASAFVIPNYRVMLVNKYDSALPFTLGRSYDFIIDNNPSTFACCKRHFFAMLASYRRLLNPGGYLLTDRQGLGWISTNNDAGWRLDYEDWVFIASRLGLVPARLTDWVYVLLKPRTVMGRAVAHTLRLRTLLSGDA